MSDTLQQVTVSQLLIGDVGSDVVTISDGSTYTGTLSGITVFERTSFGRGEPKPPHISIDLLNGVAKTKLSDLPPDFLVQVRRSGGDE